MNAIMRLDAWPVCSEQLEGDLALHQVDPLLRNHSPMRRVFLFSLVCDTELDELLSRFKSDVVDVTYVIFSVVFY